MPFKKALANELTRSASALSIIPTSATMKLITSLTGVACLMGFVIAHEGHEELQMPLEYVRYPYQAHYPGDNDGDLRSISSIAMVSHTLYHAAHSDR